MQQFQHCVELRLKRFSTDAQSTNIVVNGYDLTVWAHYLKELFDKQYTVIEIRRYEPVQQVLKFDDPLGFETYEESVF